MKEMEASFKKFPEEWLNLINKVMQKGYHDNKYVLTVVEAFVIVNRNGSNFIRGGRDIHLHEKPNTSGHHSFNLHINPMYVYTKDNDLEEINMSRSQLLTAYKNGMYYLKTVCAKEVEELLEKSKTTGVNV